jgi:hypothetical protein
MAEVKIDLSKHQTPGAKVFVGRDRGEEVRKSSGINEIEKENDTIVISIPSDIYSINSSFLEEFLKDVVEKLGKEGFYKKISFEGGYDIKGDLEEAIYNILRKSNALR